MPRGHAGILPLPVLSLLHEFWCLPPRADSLKFHRISNLANDCLQSFFGIFKGFRRPRFDLFRQWPVTGDVV